MLFGLIFMILFGIGVGYFVIPVSWLNSLDLVSTILLAILLLGIGIDLGGNKKIFTRLKELGIKVLLVPIFIACGSIIGAVAAGALINIPVNEAGAVGAGFGWYSLSGILLGKIHSAKLGALAFLTNVFREILAIILIPLMAKLTSGIAVIAPGGATTMDTTLPLIAESVKKREIVVIAFISGAVLSALVPVLVPLLLEIKFIF